MGRYLALRVYSAGLQVLGLVLVVAAIVVGVIVGMSATRAASPSELRSLVAMSAAIGGGGVVFGVVVAALGQVFQVLVDIEENTRLRREDDDIVLDFAE